MRPLTINYETEDKSSSPDVVNTHTGHLAYQILFTAKHLKSDSARKQKLAIFPFGLNFQIASQSDLVSGV